MLCKCLGNYPLFLGVLIPLSSAGNIKSSQACMLTCLLAFPLPSPGYKKHHILKWNKGNENQKSVFCVRSKTYVKNEDSKWWICVRPLALFPSVSFYSSQKHEMCRSVTAPSWGSHSCQGSRPGTAVASMFHVSSFWRAPGDMQVKLPLCFSHVGTRGKGLFGVQTEPSSVLS